MPTTHLIDLYHESPEVLLHEAVNYGLVALAPKAGQGSHEKDSVFSNSMARAAELKLARFPFLFLDGSDPDAQWANFRESLTAVGEFYPALDYEENPEGPSATLPILQRVNHLIVTELGRHPLLYGSDMLQQVFDLFPENPIWAADISRCPTWPPESRFLFWQFSWNGDGRAAPEGVDCSQWMLSNITPAGWYAANKVSL